MLGSAGSLQHHNTTSKVERTGIHGVVTDVLHSLQASADDWPALVPLAEFAI